MFKKILGIVNNWRLRLGWWFWVVLVVAAVLVFRVLSGSGKTIKVQTVKLTQGDLVQTVSTSGTVKANQHSVLTFPGGGKVAGVFVKSGDQVKKGKWIAQLDSIPLNAAYQQAVNNYRNYQAVAEQVLDSVKDHSSDETFTQKATRTTAEVNRDNAYNAMLAAQDNLANAVIYAPFDGVMDTVSPSSPGMQVMPGAANYTIVNPDTVYFDAEVEETDLPNVVKGQKVDIKLDAYPNITLTGEVTVVGLVAFTSSTGGNAYHIRISLPDNSSQKFKVGMQGDSDIILNTIPGVSKILSSAIVSDNSKNYVWLVVNGKAKKTEITVGASSSEETEIKSGLTPDSVVIDNPAANLKNGQRVNF